MPHFKKYFPTGFIDESDLPKDATVKIESVAVEALQLPGSNSKEDKVVMTFAGAKKKLVLNKTNAKIIAAQHGTDTDTWKGQEITLYFDPTVRFGKQVVGGVRVREGKKQ